MFVVRMGVVLDHYRWGGGGGLSFAFSLRGEGVGSLIVKLYIVSADVKQERALERLIKMPTTTVSK